MGNKCRILFLDDRSRRIHAAFERWNDGNKLRIVTNVPECLYFLAHEEYDLVSLDFDLGGLSFQDPEDPTCGMEIVRYLEKTGWPPDRKRPKIFIHSSNIFAAKIMCDRLTTLDFAVTMEPIPNEI